MTPFPKIVPKDAVCEVCKKSALKGRVACVQQITDDEGNKIEGPFVWYHHKCLKKAKIK